MWTAIGSIPALQGWIGKPPHGQGERRPAEAQGEPAEDVAGPMLAEIDAPDAYGEDYECGSEPEAGDHPLWYPAQGQADDQEDQEPAEEGDMPARVAEAARVHYHVEEIP